MREEYMTINPIIPKILNGDESEDNNSYNKVFGYDGNESTSLNYRLTKNNDSISISELTNKINQRSPIEEIPDETTLKKLK